jgi:NAD(P)H-binding
MLIHTLMTMVIALCWTGPFRFHPPMGTWVAALTASSSNPASTTKSGDKFPNSGMKVAVIGSTGRLGYATVQQLSQNGIATRCLIRPTSTATNGDSTKSKSTRIAQLQTLPGVELVPGDINDPSSLIRLIDGTVACYALHGPTVPKPFMKAFFPWWYKETDVNHPKQINYIGIQTLLSVMTHNSTTCKHLIRITGKGETPWSIFSILINTLGGIAKGWNYEGEQLIRNQADIRYTIVRPGVMQPIETLPLDGNVLGLRDNGNDMKVSVVSYTQIAQLLRQVLLYKNCHRTTLTAMNVPVVASPHSNSHHAGGDPTTTTTTMLYQTMAQVQPDTRAFPPSLIAEHKKAARVGGLSMLLMMGSFLVSTILFLLRLF